MISDATRKKLGRTQLKRRLASRLRVDANRLIDLISLCTEFGLDIQAKQISGMATKLAAMSLAINAVADEERDPRGARRADGGRT